MTMVIGRRNALQTFGVGAAAGAIGLLDARLGTARAAAGTPLMSAGAGELRALMERLDKAPRRRDFKTVPMVLTRPEEWDHEALSEVLAYEAALRQVWDNTDIGSPWPNLMRNSLNAQVWSFRHPHFLVASATHGTAQLALYDQLMWDKYQLNRLAGDRFKTNTLIERKAEFADPANFEDPAGAFSAANNSIRALMLRGVVFLACHNAIWDQSAALIERGVNPDELSHETLAAELTNHLIPGVILTPGVAATLPELQQAGFYYAK